MVLNSIGATCNSLLGNIRESGLNFSCQETPFSMYITVRKSFSKIRTSSLSINPHDCPVGDPQQHALQQQHEAPLNNPSQLIEDLLVQRKTLEKALNSTKQNLEKLQNECDLREEVIEDLEEEKLNHSKTISDLELKVKSLEIATKNAESLTSENIVLKSKISDLNRDLKLANKEVKTFKKNLKQREHELVKNTESFEAKMKDLIEFRADKLAEEKELKSREKFLKNKFKCLEEEKAKLSVNKKAFERDIKQNIVDTDSASSQTEPNFDIPYHISAQLPPIFSSKLCNITPRIKYLSRSLPNLDTILWVTPDTSYVDEFLSQQHENMVKQVYISRREQAQARKLERILETYDLALTSPKQVADILMDDSYYEDWTDALQIDSL